MGTSMGLYRTLGDVGFLLGPVLSAAVLEMTMVGGRVTIYPFLVPAFFVTAAGLLLLLARDPVGERRRAERRAKGSGTATNATK
jgi:MFS family permease